MEYSDNEDELENVYLNVPSAPHIGYGGGAALVWLGISIDACAKVIFINGGSLIMQSCIEEEFYLVHSSAITLSSWCGEMTDHVQHSASLNTYEGKDMLGKHVRSQTIAPTIVNGLYVALHQEWRHISQNSFHKNKNQ